MGKKHTTRKLFLKIEYLSLELEETNENSQEYQKLFNRDFQREIQYLNSVQNKEKIVIHPEINTTKSHPKFVQKIYRNIAKKLHPDISQAPNAEEIFKEVTDNYETNNLIGLIMTCNQHKISLPDLTDENIQEIEENIKVTENKINDQRKTLAWIWGSATKDKDQLKDRVCELIGINKEDFEKWKS